MTDMERQQTFMNKYRALSAAYGFDFAATIHPHQYGDMWQMEAQIGLQAVPDWQPPTAPSEDEQRNAEAVRMQAEIIRLNEEIRRLTESANTGVSMPTLTYLIKDI
jgi:hypothetical protein